MTILSSFTHPQVVALSFFLLNTKEDILKNDWNQTVFGTIDFHSRKKNTMEVSGAKVPIVLQRVRNSYRIANNLRVSK